VRCVRWRTEGGANRVLSNDGTRREWCGLDRHEDFEMAERVRPWSPPQMIVSAVLAMLIWSAVGFSWFGFGFDWETPTSADRNAEQTLTENLADICVAQARRDADSQQALAGLAAADHWKQREFIESKKWATMPGSESSHSGVADRCAQKLLGTS
jgi:hypothetical protein